ncbi:transcriptional regulator, IclR family [Cryobacterium flavum]|uniref:IclR family transcriptional regulator n=1 Tax=Cryobacterium flavum TaxID=1424659 RepID=A0A4R8V2F8_9MICO|nr:MULTISPECIES: IclR family transcriptional regulator C-terminal domain-containing protein [Cryobacterium]TFB75539.1 IclR family transcriptional regulator [Cryobacterium flavum]TFD05583.1 IclR family transcriptional regulator [Cryobacterium sp. TMT1-66-1]TFD08769.1 IclR family transcriptional regulator [Cryobacterium sp. TMT1-2-2]SDN73524.1 transcriptional regulator, IclR family [Cryobacterium flavum]
MEKADSTTRTAERALTLLSVVCEGGSVTLGDAAKAADLSPSTALRLLRTLESTSFVRRDDAGLYRPGTAIVRLGVLALSQESLVAVCREPMNRIVGETAESVYLSVAAAAGQGLYIAIVEGTHSVRHANWVGRRFPLESSASGRVLAGATGDSGYCVVSDGVEQDVTAIAVPIRVGERVVGALSVVVPSYRVTPSSIEHMARVLLTESSALYRAEASV